MVAREQVFTAVDWHNGGTPVETAHHVMTAANPRDSESGTLERLDDLGSRYSRDAAGHKPASYQESGHVECQSQLIRWPDLLEQQLEAGTQVRDCFLSRGPLAERGDIGTQMGRRIPAVAVLILLNDVGHVNGLGHVPIMHGLSGLGNRDYVSSSRDILSYGEHHNQLKTVISTGATTMNTIFSEKSA